MSNDSENSKIKLIKIFKNININKLPKETLIELIYFFNALSDTEFFECLTINLNTIEDKNKKFNDINIRTNSLLSKFTEKKYIQKVETSEYKLYEYQEHFDIYFSKKITEEGLYNFLKNYKFKIVEICHKSKSKYVTLYVFNELKTIALFDNIKNFKKEYALLKLSEYDFSTIKIKLHKNTLNKIITLNFE